MMMSNTRTNNSREASFNSLMILNVPRFNTGRQTKKSEEHDKHNMLMS